jgi:hypothetical protein
MSILSSTYQLYACGKISMRALILNENLNFSRSPYDVKFIICRIDPGPFVGVGVSQQTSEG